MEKNYFIRKFNSEIEKGEKFEVVADALRNIAEAARLEGAWPIWNEVNEAMMKLGI